MDECSVLIPSTDSFSDIWDVTLQCKKRFWPDCPWKTFSTSETKQWGENPILVGDRPSWSDSLIFALNSIESEFVLMFLEDMLICDPVDTEKCNLALTVMKTNRSPGCVLLGPGPQRFDVLSDKTFGKIPNDELYRISTSPTLWRKSFLLKILRPAENAWQFEMNGTERSFTQPEEVWRIHEEPYPIRGVYTAIQRGKAGQCAIDWLQRIGIEWKTTREIEGQK